MAGIFTRPELAKIINDEALDADERINRIMSLRGRDLDDGYVSKSAAKAAHATAHASESRTSLFTTMDPFVKLVQSKAIL